MALSIFHAWGLAVLGGALLGGAVACWLEQKP